MRRNLRFLTELSSQRGWRYDLVAASVSESLANVDFYATLNPSKSFEKLSDQEIDNFKKNRLDFQQKKISQIASETGMTNYEDNGNVSSAAFLNFVEEAEQSVKIAPDDEKFFIELAETFYSCDAEKAKEFTKKYEKSHFVPAFLDPKSSENDKIVDRKLFESLLPCVSELLVDKEIAKMKRNDKKNLVKEREELGLRKTPNAFIMFGKELREKMKDEKIKIQDIKAAWDKLSEEQLEVAEKKFLQVKSENEAKNEVIVKMLLSDRKWALLQEPEILAHGEDSDLFEYKIFWEARNAVFDGFKPEMDPLLQFKKASDVTVKRSMRKELGNFPVKVTKAQFLLALPENQGLGVNSVFKKIKPVREKEWTTLNAKYEQQFLAALKSALANGAYLALNRKEMYELGSKEQRAEWAEAWEAWSKKTTF
ncbi:unnamed protein product [Oikopleura dioica]|uniref:Uncharacterized protein n=1 Tax=Oikopleura dioica TaxID=34765 RepID=E4XWV7_OIKDI|nr:unnamed protein product [Oikopleura dioica]